MAPPTFRTTIAILILEMNKLTNEQPPIPSSYDGDRSPPATGCAALLMAYLRFRV